MAHDKIMQDKLPAKRPPDVAQLLESQRLQIMKALPKHLTPDRFARIALTEIRKNPQLALCEPNSFLGAVIQAAQLGLEPGSGLGHCYLIPFRNKAKGIVEVNFIPGYRGLIDLARRSGQVETISARIVRDADFFHYEYGDDERIKHVPFEGTEEDAGRIRYAYAIARMKGGGLQREVMTRAQIDRIKDRGNKNPVWDTDFDEMARKTAVRRICKYLPLSPEMAAVIEADDTAYEGKSQENWRVIDANFEPRASAQDIERFRAASEEGGSYEETAPEQERRAQGEREDRDNANMIFDEAYSYVLNKNGKPMEILGMSPAQFAEFSKKATADQIVAAADRLKEWKP